MDVAIAILLHQKKKQQFQIFYFKMKCKQKLCQRNKSLQENGNVCDDAIFEALRKQKDLVSKKPALDNIQVDLRFFLMFTKSC